MRIEFISIKMKNILSYGSSITELQFTEGLNAITGVNGRGKSTFLDALSFNLFGVPYRKITLKELINRTNEKGLWTESEFRVNKSHYKITRTLKPDTLTIEKNGEVLESLSSKKLDQEEIDGILGVNHKIFKQIICLAVNYNKPFLSLGATEKRDIVESIFNIKVFANMLKLCKNEQTGLKTQYQINSKNIELMNENLKTLQNQILEVKHASANFEQNKKIDIEKANNNIKELKNKIYKCQQNIDTGKGFLDELIQTTDKEIKEKIKKINSEIDVLEYKISQNEKDIKFLDDNTDCPFCKSELTEKHKEEHQKTMVDDNVNSNKRIEVLKVELDTLNDELVEIKTINKKIDNIQSAITKEKIKIDSYDDTVNIYEKEIENIENKKFEIDVYKMVDNLDNKNKEYENTVEENKFISEEILENEIIINVLSDKGIKAFFFNIFLPILNTKIEHYLKLFEMPITLKFDELLKETIIGVKGKKLSYMGFSEGEKQRINISILLSFIDTTKYISNWDTNLIFFDELFDSGVDQKGIEQILEAIKDISDDDSKLCIYLISHKLSDDSMFKNKIEVTKKGDFSNVKIN